MYIHLTRYLSCEVDKCVNRNVCVSKETYKRDLISSTWHDERCEFRQMCQNRPVHIKRKSQRRREWIKRDVNESKETWMNQKRREWIKRDVNESKETYTHQTQVTKKTWQETWMNQKRREWIKRDVRVSNETYKWDLTICTWQDERCEFWQMRQKRRTTNSIHTRKVYISKERYVN